MKPDDIKIIAEQVATLLQTPPASLYIIFGLIFLLILTIGYLVLRDRFSRAGRDLAETQHLMAQANRETLEAAATTPQLIKAISDLVRDTVHSKFDELQRTIPSEVDESVTKRAASIADAVTKADEQLRQILEKHAEVTNVVAKIEHRLEQSNALYKNMDAILPAYELWRSVADPESLYLSLTEQDNMNDDAKGIIRQLQNLIETSSDHPEMIPAKFIEATGDWCRRKNQFGLALWFYQSAVKRDPDRITAKVELLALTTEYVPQERDIAISELGHIAELINDKDTILRIFDAFIEPKRYDDLVILTTRLLEKAPAEDRIFRAQVLRNRAVAKKGGGEFVSEEVLSDLGEAVELAPQDENVLSLFAEFLKRSGKYEGSVAVYKKLLEIDHTDVRYYSGLAEAYLHLGDTEAALEVYRLGLPHATTTSQVWQYQQLHRTLRRPLSAAEANVQAAIRALPLL